ncbi:Ngg1p interacting factor 3, NIF3 [Kalmanozyma brasiliensis GHG001]|uniref:Ngg1p-interacting factor 3 n=1 Tax=Kalmanozyma brasiliensis (strain GHG001) TaxID=1365824 RepID=V5GJ35_KALBG|nr:Ngg1p interacting factor 3, NIF3 [Kalmanozyma brasiliensis GHG001]EST05992.1 Ngg1p interacting factor 3, NIF3 [Kalmanozyma brasiliensis GHG001]
MSQPNWQITGSVKQNPILTSIMEAMRRIAPLSLADTSFDNVGILLQAPPATQAAESDEKQGVMLAIDLTTDVCDEILSSADNVKVALVYHPIIFRGLKSLTFADPQQTSLLRLAAAGVSIYCPHTSLDATPGGINDWLGKVVSSKDAFAELESPEALDEFRANVFPALSNSKNTPKGFEAAGMGRFIELEAPQPFDEIVRRVKQNLDLPHVQGCKASDKPISSIAVCAGSGSSVFSGVKADLYLTGELSHHEILAYKAAGASVIVTNHTNTERKYLRDVLQHWLRRELPSRYSVSVSKTDRDPLTVL